MTTHEGIKVKLGTFEKIGAILGIVLPLTTMIYYFGQEHQAFADLKESIVPKLVQVDQNTKDIATMQGELKNYTPLRERSGSSN